MRHKKRNTITNADVRGGILETMKEYKVLFLTCNKNTLGLYKWLETKVNVKLLEEKITLDFVREYKPNLIVSYNYSYIISKNIIEYMCGNIVNLHISYLPWNRGASPNFWSFIDDTPKGVTIHQIDSGLDTGKIIFQKKCLFDISKETFASTYEKLNYEIIELFKKNWKNIKEKKYVLHEQTESGSYHTTLELDELKRECPFEWCDNIEEYIKKYEKYKTRRN